jgi:hypothetical protein
MKLVADWGVRSPRLDRLLEAGCSHCDAPFGRLVRHDARGGGTQVWLSCASCCARLGNALPHSEHRRLASYPLWREDLDEEPTPEEVEEIVLEAKSVALTELLAAIPNEAALERMHRAEHITVDYEVSEGESAALARVVLAGARRCRLCHFSIEDAIDPALSAIWFGRAPT